MLFKTEYQIKLEAIRKATQPALDKKLIRKTDLLRESSIAPNTLNRILNAATTADVKANRPTINSIFAALVKYKIVSPTGQVHVR